MSGTAAKTTRTKSESQTASRFFGGGPDRVAAPFFSASVARVQRKCAGCEAEAKRQFQPKLTVGNPDDRFEQEADRTAEQVMRMPEPTVQRQFEPEDRAEDIAQTKPLISPWVQRKVEEDELLQTKEISGMTTSVTPDVHALQGGGQPLSDSERNFFEPRFGNSFGQVRVHTNDSAAGAAKSVNARAFTVGRVRSTM